MVNLCQLAAKKGWKVFLLGGMEGAAEKAAEELNSSLKIETDQGVKDIKNEKKEENERIIRKINQFQPQLLFVAYGAPYQEKWIAKNLPKLKVNIAMGAGGAFDYISGKVGRSPQFVREIGLEWLWRLIREPWRIKRQLALIKFLLLVIKEK